MMVDIFYKKIVTLCCSIGDMNKTSTKSNINSSQKREKNIFDTKKYIKIYKIYYKNSLLLYYNMFEI